MKTIPRSLTLALALIASGGGAQTPQNILLIIADDIGVEKLAAYQSDLGHSNPVAQTPTLDALAANGVRFTQVWSNPTCSPTRAGILLGRHAFRHSIGVGVGANTGPVLDPAETTLAEIITGAGASAALFGKWHLGTARSQGRRDAPRITGGFDRHAGSLKGRVRVYEAWKKAVDGSVRNAYSYATFDTAQETIDWVSGQTGQWLAVVSFNAPHTPLHAPPGYDTELAGVHCSSDVSSDDDLLCYRAMVEYMDGEIDRILDEIEQMGQLAETTVIFTGDNGSSRALAEAPFVKSKVKGSVYQGGIHVPLLISGGWIDAPGRANDSLVHTTDLFATVLDLAGFDTELAAHRNAVTLDSVSLVPYLVDKAQTALRGTVYTEAFAGGDPENASAAMRDIRYKLIRKFTNGSVTSEEFYDLASAVAGTDPEATDLLAGSLTAAQDRALLDLRSAMDALRATEGY